MVGDAIPYKVIRFLDFRTNHLTASNFTVAGFLLGLPQELGLLRRQQFFFE